MGIISYIGSKLSNAASFLGRKIKDGANFLATKAPLLTGALSAARNILASPLVQRYVPAAQTISRGLDIVGNVVQSQRQPAQRQDRAPLEARNKNLEEAVMKNYPQLD